MATAAQPTLWEKTKNVSNVAYEKAKPGFDKVYNVGFPDLCSRFIMLITVVCRQAGKAGQQVI